MRSTKGNPEKAAELLNEGKPIVHALLEAGYSEAVARQGKKSITKPIRDELIAMHSTRIKELAQIGRSVSPQEQEDIVRGALVQNALEGQDRAAMSLKLLGQDRRVNMWTPDVQMGVIVLQSPKDLEPTILEANTDAGTE